MTSEPTSIDLTAYLHRIGVDGIELTSGPVDRAAVEVARAGLSGDVLAWRAAQST